MSEGKVHSKIGASSMHRWAACPGSVKLCEGMPNVSSAYAAEGTLAHELAEALLTGKPLPQEDVTPEMIEAVSVYVDYLKSETLTANPDDVIHIEHGFDLSPLYPGLFGTSDCVIYRAREKKLIVIDYKHGAGIPVEVERNSQLMYYGLGALISLGYPAKTIELVIVQPRCNHSKGPIRKWEISALELQDFAADLIDYAKKTEDPNAPLYVGPHCRFCPAQVACPKMHEKALVAASSEFGAFANPVANTMGAGGVTPERLAEFLDLLPTLESFVTAVREYAYREAMAGRTPRGWKLVDKRATRKWAESEAGVASALLACGLKESDLYERKLKSPAQMEKVLKSKTEREAILSPLISWVSSGMTLVPESDKRPIAVSTPLDDFSKV